MPDFDDVLTGNTSWCRCFGAELDQLSDNALGQLEAWPADDYVAAKRYGACPRRGLHRTLVESWLCWCDVAWGHAAAADVLVDGGA